MKINIAQLSQFKKTALIFAVFIVFAAVAALVQTVSAQTAPPDFCLNGYPSDPVQYEQCLQYEIANQGTQTASPNTSTTSGPGTGTWGLASAEDPFSKTILFVAANPTASSAIMGSIHTSASLTMTYGPFEIDQSASFVGNPEVVFNPTDKRYLVVWSDSRRTGGSVSIFGRFVNPDGTFVGNDFAIHNDFDVLADSIDLTYDAKNNEYVVGAHTPNLNVIRTITSDGTVSQANTYNLIQNGYEGMMSVVYNPVLNEYWYVSSDIDGSTGATVPQIYLHRVDRTTMQVVGQPILISQTGTAATGFTNPQIDYSPVDGAAVIVWQARGVTPGQASEIYGRTVYNNLTTSQVYPVLTPTTYSGSGFFGSPTSMKYNPTTNSFMLAVEDGNGGTTYAEFDSSGLILETTQCIPQMHTNGNFQPALGTADGQGLCMASPGYAQSVMTTVPSTSSGAPISGQPPVQNPRPADDLDSSALSQLVSQGYLWALGIAAMLAVQVSVWGGYLVMTARGNAAQATKGKEYLYGAIAGLVMLMAAYLLLNTINPDLTNFSTGLDALE